MRIVLGLVIVVLTACASTGPLADLAVGPNLPHQISNQGGGMEGHTPRGFAGSGTGLFAGDDLNPNFPPDDGIQIWLTFQLPFVLPAPEEAMLRSELLDPRGSPFTDLGTLLAEPIAYDSFDRENFDLAAIGEAVECVRPTAGSVECDVTEAVRSAIDDSAARVLFRLKFQTLTDGDGEPDLARFFRSDPNTNERGIFTLDLR